MQSHFNKLCEKLCVNQNKRVLTPALNIINFSEFAVDLVLLLSLCTAGSPCQGFVLH